MFKFISIKISSAGLLLLVGACGTKPEASSPYESTIELSDGSVLKPGKGFDSHSTSARGFCVKETPLKPILSNENSQKSTFEMREVESFESLKESLNITASGAFKNGIYGGSAKASYFSSSDINQFSSFMLVHVQVTNMTKGLTSYKLTDAAQNAKHDKQAFFSLCGDRFVSAVTTGGEFLAIVEFRSRSEEQRKEISAKIRGSAGAWSLSGSFQQKMEHFSQYVETSIRIMRVGGSGNLPEIDGADKGVDSLISYASKFPSLVSHASGNAYPYTVTYEDYNVVDDYAVTPISLEIQKQILDELAANKFRANILKSNANYILLNSHQFTNVNQDQLRSWIADLNVITNKLNAAATHCFANPFLQNGCVVPTELPWPVISWPSRVSGMSLQSVCDKERDYLHATGKLADTQYLSLKEDNLVPQYKDPRNRLQGSIGLGDCADVGTLLYYLWN